MPEELPTLDPTQAPSHNDAPKALVPVLDVLRGLNAAQIAELLDAEHSVDPKAGIVHVTLPDAGEVVVEGQAYHFHGARVMPEAPGQPNYVNPHVHQVGDEPYIFLDGDGGEMNKGAIVDGQVVWDPPRAVQPGEIEIVKPGEVHSFRNNNSDPTRVFDFGFACPDNHLVDRTPERPDGDREFTTKMGVGNPLPPHYPALPTA